MKKKICVTLLVIFFITGCITISQKEITSWVKGRDYFHYKSLGQSTRTAIPYALWLAMMEKYPDDLGVNWKDFSRKFGLINDPKKNDKLPVGFVIHKDSLFDTDFLATNCSLCHTAKIDNNIINGLGARSLKLNSLNNTVMNIVTREDFIVDKILPIAKRKAKENHLNWGLRSNITTRIAIKELRKISKKHINIDSGPGRNTPVEFAKLSALVKVSYPYGYVRFPPVWTYSKRKSFGWDASMEGDLALAAASVEFNKGMSSNYIVKHRDRWDDIYSYVKTLKPPAFPQHVDQKIAKRGENLYLQNCNSCHGNSSSYNEKIIPLQEIGTDPDRLLSMNKALSDARNSTNFGKIVPLKPSLGYVPPPLDGIWSRAPYLHNGSVPTLYDLLLTPTKRPSIFYINPKGYDFQYVGLQDFAKSSDRLHLYKFNTMKEGNSNKGHEYGTTLPEIDKMALIEYLKQL